MTERPRSGGKKPKGRKADETELSDEELARETGQPLPDRAALSTLQADVAIPVNPALAAEVLAGPDEEFGEPVEPEETTGEDEPEAGS
jgi:hypothetical protein